MPDGNVIPFHNSKSGKKTGRSKEPNPAVNELKDFWATEYQKRLGLAYSFNHAADGTHFKELLATFDAVLIKDRILKFFDFDDEWIQTIGGYTVGVFRKRINTLNSIGRRSAPTPQQELPA